jgi:phage terminase small subunit
MPELRNPKHEKFAQNIARGLSPTEAYISAGYSRKSAHSSAFRLQQNATIMQRLQGLRTLVTSAYVELAITERDQRLLALQDRWDALRQAAIETGQEQENVNLTGQISAKSIALSKVMSLPELEELERKMLAVMEAERQGKTIEVAPP